MLRGEHSRANQTSEHQCMGIVYHISLGTDTSVTMHRPIKPSRAGRQNSRNLPQYAHGGNIHDVSECPPGSSYKAYVHASDRLSEYCQCPKIPLNPTKDFLKSI